MKPAFFICIAALSLSGHDYRSLIVELITGEEISIAELTVRGPVLINFWALWCEPCKLEMKQLQSLYEKYNDRNFSIVAVNQDNQKSIAKVSSYLASQRFSFHVVTDPDGEIAQRFNVQNIPFSILIDTSGKVVYTSLGYKPGDEQKLEQAIVESIEGKNVP